MIYIYTYLHELCDEIFLYMCIYKCIFSPTNGDQDQSFVTLLIFFRISIVAKESISPLCAHYKESRAPVIPWQVVSMLEINIYYV